MLGVPYEGRIPDFSAQPAMPDLSSSPTAVAGRAVRQEQDYAYQQSLQVSIHSCFLGEGCCGSLASSGLVMPQRACWLCLSVTCHIALSVWS